VADPSDEAFPRRRFPSDLRRSGSIYGRDLSGRDSDDPGIFNGGGDDGSRGKPPPPPVVDGGNGGLPGDDGQSGGSEGETPPVEKERNTAPIAEPGDDRTATAGDAVALDGSGSWDDDGDPLIFRWYLVSKPLGSSAELSDAAAIKPVFTPDLPGLYLVELIVSDGQSDSPAQTVLVTAEQRRATMPPVVGLDVEAAKEAIREANLALGRITVAADDSAPRNRVLEQHPAAGARVPENTPVDLVIALPSTADDDGDSLPDAWEYAVFGGLTHGDRDDPDRDGYSNREEFLVGTDPNDGGDAPVPAGNYFEYDVFGRIVVKQITLEP
jgi:hypothetical protein